MPLTKGWPTLPAVNAMVIFPLASAKVSNAWVTAVLLSAGGGEDVEVLQDVRAVDRHVEAALLRRAEDGFGEVQADRVGRLGRQAR